MILGKVVRRGHSWTGISYFWLTGVRAQLLRNRLMDSADHDGSGLTQGASVSTSGLAKPLRSFAHPFLCSSLGILPRNESKQAVL